MFRLEVRPISLLVWCQFLLQVHYLPLAQAATPNCGPLLETKAIVARMQKIIEVSRPKEQSNYAYRLGLSPGKTYFLEPDGFNAFPRIKKKLKGPVRVEILERKKLKKGQFGKDTLFLIVKTKEFGILTIPFDDALLSLTTDGLPIWNKTELVEGDWVTINWPEGESLMVTDYNFPPFQITLGPSVNPFVAKLNSFLDDEFALVTISHNSNIQRQITVERKYLTPTFLGNRDTWKEAIAPLLDIPLQFEIGEKVRFRNLEGDLMTGQISDVSPQGFAIVSRGKSFSIRSDEVFKTTRFEPIPVNPLVPSNGAYGFCDVVYVNNSALLERKPGKPFRIFLNAMARLTSIPENQEADSRRILQSISQVLKTLFRYRDEMLYAETYDLSQSDIMSCGSVVCRHFATYINLVLAESGIQSFAVVSPPKLTTRNGIENLVAHAWNEIVLPENGKLLIYDATDYRPVVGYKHEVLAKKIESIYHQTNNRYTLTLNPYDEVDFTPCKEHQ